MRIISRRPLRKFALAHPDSEQQLDAWWEEAKNGAWKNPEDIKAKYRSASILKGRRVVFNICGNKYRLIVKFDYEAQLGFVRFVGTHGEYDKIDAEEV